MKNIKQQTKKACAMLFSAIILSASCPIASVKALTPDDSMYGIPDNQFEPVYEDNLTAEDLPDSNTLEQMYINKLLYGGGVSLCADYGRERLTGEALQIYNDLRPHIEAVANGIETSTLFLTSVKRTVPIEGDEFKNAFSELCAAANEAWYCLRVDLPEDFYWSNKKSSWSVVDYSYVPGYEPAEGMMTFAFVAKFYVANDYMGADNTTVNPQKINEAKASVENAKRIAAKYNGQSAYNKILGYKEEICNLVSYDRDAAEKGSAVVGNNPWQLIWVFDNNPNTNVVCEGYSKAFQYLCDLGGIDCYTVTGNMNGGGHMWNIVKLGGKYYHVDITNCDSGMSGSPDSLFLKGAAESSPSGFRFIINKYNRELIYAYKDDTIAMYPAEILTVSTTDYDPTQSGFILGDADGDGYLTGWDLIVIQDYIMTGDYSKIDITAADADKDEHITGWDLILIRDMILNN